MSDVSWHGAKFLTEAEKQVRQNLESACLMVRNDVIRSMKPGTGRLYFRRKGGKAGGRFEKLVSKKGRFGTEMMLTKGFKTKKGGAAMSNYKMHQASAPGRPPAPDTGHYKQSIDWTIERRGSLFVGIVGTNVEYGKWLEEGTKHMKKRPHFIPALRRQRSRIVSMMRRGFKN